MAAMSCQKENNIDNPGAEPELVPMTFSAMQVPDGVDDSDTKATLEGLAIHWTAGDKIAVFDNVNPSTPHEFIAASTGESTSFSGNVSAGATKFFAVYPYSAADNCDMTEFQSGDYSYVGSMNVNIPTEQNAVAGSFDPSAAVLAAYTDDNAKAFSFRIPFALAKFTVAYDDVKSVTFSSGKNMTGSLKINMRDNGNIGTQDGDGTKVKNLTLANADGSSLTPGATYYVVLRYRTGASNAYTDFTVNISRGGGKSGSATASANVEIARNNIKNFGDFAGMSFATSRYAAYQQGEDIVIAGKTYNKSTDGDAVLLPSGQNISDSKITAKVHFLSSGENYTASGLAIAKEVVIASDDPDVRAKISPYSGGSSWKLNSGSLALEGVEIDMSPLTSSGSTVTFFNNSGATEDFERLAISNCCFGATENEKPMYLFAVNSGKAGYAIKEILVSRCVLNTSGKLTTIINPTSNATAANKFEKIEFVDNVVCSLTGSNVKMQLFSFSGTKSPATGWNNVQLIVNNNIFYNVTTSSGLVRNYDLGSVEIKDNIFYATDNTDAGGNAKVFALSVSDNSTFKASEVADGNLAYGALSSGSWVICDGKYRTDTSIPSNIELLESSPFTSASVPSQAIFELTPACGNAGPAVMPTPLAAP